MRLFIEVKEDPSGVPDVRLTAMYYDEEPKPTWLEEQIVRLLRDQAAVTLQMLNVTRPEDQQISIETESYYGPREDM